MNEFILLLILAYSFLFTWSIYHAEKITDNHQRGLIYDSSILSYSLPFCILIFAVGAILFYPKLSADLLIQICTNIFISIIFYYMVFYTVTYDTKKTDSNFHRESMGNAESAVSDVPFL